MIDFDFPLSRSQASIGCALEGCENNADMSIDDTRYCYKCGVPVLAYHWLNAERALMREIRKKPGDE